MELLWGRRFVEVEVAAKDLICALPRQHHLDAQSLDAPGQEVHRDCSPHLPPKPASHYEIWKYCQSTSKVQAEVLQNLRVPQYPARRRFHYVPPWFMHSTLLALMPSTCCQLYVVVAETTS